VAGARGAVGPGARRGPPRAAGGLRLARLHLYRFAVGEPFDESAEKYLCPFEVEEGEAVGLDARDARLDELLTDSGDSRRYAYDYCDGWEVALRLPARGGWTGSGSVPGTGRT
jgi:hypothetical protein